MIRILITLLSSLLLVTACNADNGSEVFKEGVNYKIIKPAGKVSQKEVTEFFSYGCPHCFEAEPVVQEWHKTNSAVKLNRMAVVGFRPEWDAFAKAYYTAEVLGIAEKMHVAMFKQIHELQQAPVSDEAIAKFLAQFGVSEAQVMGTLNSFAVNAQLGVAKQKQAEYRIRSVPTFIVNDKFVTDVPMAGSFEALPHVLNFLTQK